MEAIHLALFRRPGALYAHGLTQAELGLPDLQLALRQHESVVQAFRDADIETMVLSESDVLPDSVFVEDCAVIAGDTLIWTRPGAPSRQPEVELLQSQLSLEFDSLSIQAPGSVDGGDVCQIENKFLVGLSDRTNQEGARQFCVHVESLGFEAEVIDIRGDRTLLHLKSGLSYLGEGIVLASQSLQHHPAFEAFEVICPEPEEAYAANAVAIGGKRILFAEGYPILGDILREKGFELIELNVSEFRKMDGGLSCLSLRFS